MFLWGVAVLELDNNPNHNMEHEVTPVLGQGISPNHSIEVMHLTEQRWVQLLISLAMTQFNYYDHNKTFDRQTNILFYETSIYILV